MSRQELAEAVNAHVYRATGQVTAMDAHYVGRLERGQRCWPWVGYRDAFRAVLGAVSDTDLGFRRADRANDPVPMGEPRPVPARPSAQRGRSGMKMETIRFASRDDDETYFYRTVHQLAAGCLLLDVKDSAVTALVEVVSRAVEERQDRERQDRERQDRERQATVNG